MTNTDEDGGLRPASAQGMTWRRIGCVSVVVAGLASLVVCAGVGLPITYYHHLGYVQAFEGPDRVILFVEVERGMEWPGLVGHAPYRYAAAFYRIDVFPDGRVEKSALRSDSEGHLTFNTNLFAVARLADGFYLVETPSYAPRPAYRLDPDRIDPLSAEAAIRAAGGDLLRSSKGIFDLSQIDAISTARGWRRLNHEPGPGPHLLSSHPIDSPRNGIRLKYVRRPMVGDGSQSLVAESLSPAAGWARTLIEVDTREWTSYRSPSDRAYLRAKYAASPAR
jgi:hypothetical protein